MVQKKSSPAESGPEKSASADLVISSMDDFKKLSPELARRSGGSVIYQEVKTWGDPTFEDRAKDRELKFLKRKIEGANEKAKVEERDRLAAIGLRTEGQAAPGAAAGVEMPPLHRGADAVLKILVVKDSTLSVPDIFKHLDQQKGVLGYSCSERKIKDHLKELKTSVVFQYLLYNDSLVFIVKAFM